MSKINDGGPAFPNPALANEGFCPSYDMSGMTLRDWFAGQALAGLVGGTVIQFRSQEHLASLCYAAADAMIAQSQKQEAA